MPVMRCGSRGAARWPTQLATHAKAAGTLPDAIALNVTGFAYTPGRAPAAATAVHHSRAYSTVFAGALSNVRSSTSRQRGKSPE